VLVTKSFQGTQKSAGTCSHVQEHILVSVEVSELYRRIAMMHDLYILTLVTVFILRLS